MQTIDKAFHLLSFFNRAQPEIGLSELAKLAGFDKATTRRLLLSLMNNGMVEQNPVSRAYRLGAAVLRLAHVREETYPLSRLVKPELEQLAQSTGETVHCSELAGYALQTIEVIDSRQSIRVNVDYSEPLPLHCTASGLAVLAYPSPGFVDRVLARRLKSYTAQTDCDAKSIRQQIECAREKGFAFIDSGFETDVCGIAAPVFDRSGYAAGAVAVALPRGRLSEEKLVLIRAEVRRCAANITRALGAQPAAEFLAVA